MKLDFTLNDRAVSLEAEPDMTLLDLLRERLGLTGTKKSCGVGECGACTVIVDGDPVNSCLFLGGAAAGADGLHGGGPLP